MSALTVDVQIYNINYLIKYKWCSGSALHACAKRVPASEILRARKFQRIDFEEKQPVTKDEALASIVQFHLDV